jgi:preprotein translocase subunit SecD
MKTIKYLISAIFAIVILSFPLSCNGTGKHTLLLQSADAFITRTALDQSAQIMTRRLESFNAGKFDISVIYSKNQIMITFLEEADLGSIEKLVTQPGLIGFWETYDRNGLKGILGADNRLFSLLPAGDGYARGDYAGCTFVKDTAIVNHYLQTIKTNEQCRFAWSYDHDGSRACLYALKPAENAGPVITGSDIRTTSFDNDIIKIRLNEAAAARFADVTRRNLEKVIAIILDGEVMASPMVNSEITKGELDISGRFTEQEAGYIAAILVNGVLPSAFVVVE